MPITPVLKRFGWFLTITAMMFVSACGGLDKSGNKNINHYESLGEERQLQTKDRLDTLISMSEFNGQHYIPLQVLVDRIQMQSRWDENTQTFAIGDNDIVYELKVDSTEAKVVGEPFELADAPIRNRQGVLISEAAFYDLFSELLNYRVEGDTLFLHGLHDTLYTRPFQTEKQFPDLDDAMDFNEQDSHHQGEDWPAASPRNVDVEQLIATAKKYQGVPYEFGADSYSSSGTFDCSSFVRYVYGKQGVELPRLSREQAERGSYVSRKNLRKGDLLYFYVPGRFKTNKTVGHVGIYIGDNKMIHSSPQPEDGVQISDINKDYWKETYLKSKRVI